ncbi:NepR family anti-sigma factor [Limimaricola sp.]|uniref:NepR family anti-sigma factor n=1 Tax=Limimaricola sp. TaxID=2211665 RepID=UPI0040587B1F
MTQRDQGSARGDIDAHLKRAFQQLTDEALPDRFTDLLARLKAGEDADDASSDADQTHSDRETADASKVGRG